MSNPSLHNAAQRIDTLINMIAEDGASSAREAPPADYLRALRDAPLGRHREVADAHREGRGPPDFAAGRGPGRERDRPGNGNGGGR